MKKIYFVMFFVFLSFISKSQIDWMQTNGPKGYVVNCSSIDSTGRIWIGSNTGVYFSDDKFATRHKLITNGLSDSVVNAIAVLNNSLIVGTSDKKLYKYQNGTWTLLQTGIGVPTDIFVYSPTKLLICAYNIYEYNPVTNIINTITPVNGGGIMTINNPYKIQTNFLKNNKNQLMICSGTNYIFKSDSTCTYWTRIYLDDLCPNHTQYPRLFQIKKGIGSSIVISSDSGVYVSHDQGNSFVQKKNNSISNKWIFQMKSDGEKIYAYYTDVHKFAGPSYRNFWTVSSDSGNTWSILDSNILKSNLVLDSMNNYFQFYLNGKVKKRINNVISIDSILLKESFPTCLVSGEYNEIFTGIKSSGIYKSSDNGLNWKRINYNLPVIDFISMNNTFQKYLVAEGEYSMGGGLWYLNTESDTVWQPVYPNKNILVKYNRNKSIYIFPEMLQKWLRTDDFGATFDTIGFYMPGTSNQLLFDYMIFASNNVIYYFLDSIYKSTDQMHSFTNYAPKMVFPSLSKVGWFIDKNDTIYQSLWIKSDSSIILYKSGNFGLSWLYCHKIPHMSGAFENLVKTESGEMFAKISTKNASYYDVFYNNGIDSNWINTTQTMPISYHSQINLTLNDSGYVFWTSHDNGILRTKLPFKKNTTGIDNVQDISSFSIFPNPATNNKISIQFEEKNAENYLITIYSIWGALIFQKNIYSSQDGLYALTIDNVSKGIYVVEIENQKTYKVSSSKLIIQ